VDRLGWEVLLAENLSELLGVLDRLDEDDDLVELQLVQKVYEFSDLILVFKHNIVLLESVQGQLALVFNEDFSLVLHEFAADQFDVSGQRGREHHDLLVVWGLRENLLDVTAHA
jgi:hypothetical protein